MIYAVNTRRTKLDKSQIESMSDSMFKILAASDGLICLSEEDFDGKIPKGYIIRRIV